MPKNVKKHERNWMKNVSQNYTFSAPPHDFYGAFQPGAYYRMYHRIEAEKMKRSYDWLKFASITESDFIEIINGMIKDNIPPVKTEIGEQDHKLLEDFPFSTPSIDERIIKVEVGDDDNRKIVYIDLNDIEVQ